MRGYKKEAIKVPNVRYYDNDEYATTNEVFSLFRASQGAARAVPLPLRRHPVRARPPREAPQEPGGHLDPRRPRVRRGPAGPRRRAACPTSWPSRTRRRPATASSAPRRRTGWPASAARSPAGEAHGEFVGHGHVHREGRAPAHRLLPPAPGDPREGRLPRGRVAPRRHRSPISLQELIDRGADVQAIDVYKGWLEIDTFEDYRRAWALIKE